MSHSSGALQIVFASALVLAASLLVCSVLDRVSRRWLVAGGALLGVATLAAWVIFALGPTRGLAISAAGTTASFVVGLATLASARALARMRHIDQEVERGRIELRTLIDQEVAERTTELEQALAMARSEANSQLATQERQYAEQRRRAVSDYQQATSRKLSESLIDTQHDVEERIAAWRRDLERSQGVLAEQLTRLIEQQQTALRETERKLQADSERVASESEEQHAMIVRLRDEFQQTTVQANAASQAELESHANERRRALTEITERLVRREQELRAQIEREEVELKRRIQAGAEEIERRQLDQLQRAIERASQRFVDAATAELEGSMRTTREEAARRLGRELDRATENFGRQAQALLSERSREIEDAAKQRLERKLAEALRDLTSQTDGVIAGLDQRLARLEAQLGRAAPRSLDVETRVPLGEDHP
ncbi:MAG: hypothetical protein ACXVZW_08240 [Gaiellaceae bacterium]